MGVQILNKDVSVISSIMGRPKANISSIWGATGWSGGGADVTPNPTPDWGGAYTAFAPATIVDSNTIQVLGINTTITLGINVQTNDGGTLTVGVNTTNSYGGTITDISSGITTFTVSNNQYVTFRYDMSSFGSYIFDVINQSDGNAILGTTVTMARDVP